MQIRRKLATLATVIVVGFGSGAGLAACSSSGSSGPPTATGVLQSNGYTPSAAYTSALQNGLSGDGGVVLSSEAGTSNGNIEFVIVFDNATDAQAGESGVQSQYGGEGFNISTSGQVLTVQGTIQEFENAGNAG